MGGEAPPRRDVPRDAHGVDAGTTGGAVSPAAYPIRAEGAVPPRPAQETGGAVGQPSRPAERYQIYVPPEADYVAHIQGRGAVPPTEVAPRQRAEETPRAPAAAAEPEKTQVVFPMAQQPSPPRPVARATVTCPECYAPNPEGNSFCQECGSPLSPVAARPRTIRQAAAFREGDQRTAALAPGMVPEAEARGAYAGKTKRVPKGEKAFGVADVLALLAAGTAGAALALSSVMESFSWKKGLAVSMFTHQGAFTQGRPDLLGGPGILPYEGMEFLTVGLVAALGIALALVFLAARVGRGPMFILAGSLLLFPLAYLLFQAVLPLRQTGIEIQPSLGIGGLLSGGESNPGMGPPLWMISGAGILLLAAGFAAPPRGWGRLFTFMAFFPGVLGLAFFCAACYNWNLFISAAGMLEAWRVGAAPTAPGARILAGAMPFLL
ncbi:MAG: zinc ribbon domain-containing protein [Actinobacteria bacterium]|nr:zinc ribbon domain-containing protein [Actinomycetota bacterium]